MTCFCGCGRRAGHDHHVVYQQQLKVLAQERDRRGWQRVFRELVRDRRNIVRVAYKCHNDHHRAPHAGARYRVSDLPTSMLEFAEELMGPGRAYEYIARRYRGTDERLEALRVRSAA